jgi:hypothetical protein
MAAFSPSCELYELDAAQTRNSVHKVSASEVAERSLDGTDQGNAIFYIAQTGCQWRLLPKNLPPYTMVQRKPLAARASLTGSQSVKTNEPPGYAAEKMITGRKEKPTRVLRPKWEASCDILGCLVKLIFLSASGMPC